MAVVGCILAFVAALEMSPLPQETELHNKQVFRLLSGTPIVLAEEPTASERIACAMLFDAIGYELPLRTASAHGIKLPAIYVGESSRHAALQHKKIAKLIPGKPIKTPEGYCLTITRNAIVVAGADSAGAFYGMQTLARIAKAGIELPCLTIRDYPDLALRGALFERPPTREALRRLASLKCNLAVFTSDDFYRLSGNAAAHWKDIFAQARAFHIEPVPMIRTLTDADSLIALNPATAEGRVMEERVVLYGDDWAILSKRNLMVNKDSPMKVRVSGHLCVESTDYVLKRGTLKPPFAEDEAPWLIRRVQGGSIPDGATVSAAYAYVPPDTDVCCPSAAETEAVLHGVMQNVVEVLKPRFIHIGHDRVMRLNTCMRCRERRKTDAAVFTDSVGMIDTIVKALDPDMRLMLWSDAINPEVTGRKNPLAKAARQLPKDAILMVHGGDKGSEHIAESASWSRGLGRMTVGVSGTGMSSVYEWADMLRGHGHRENGMFYRGSDVFSTAFALTMEKSWSLDSPRSAWAETLNGYFDANLWRPSYGDVLEALVPYVNEKTLAGIAPRSHYAQFKNWLKKTRKSVPGREDSFLLTDWVYRNLVTYLELETAYAEKGRDTSLRKLKELIELQGEIDPDMDDARTRRIMDTVAEENLFVPSTILFRQHLLPFRPVHLPANSTLLETPVEPRYADSERQAMATYDFLVPPGPIGRIDFETVGTASLEVASSEAGKTFRSVQQWTSSLHGGVTGPAILEPPCQARWMRITANASAERAVLRNTRLFALKQSTALSCAYVRTVPLAGEVFNEIAWPDGDLAEGFVRLRERKFAQAPTTVRVCRSRDALYIGLMAHEPRMRTMLAVETKRDASLNADESLEIHLDTGKARPFLFMVNALGTQYDSLGGDAGWDGLWQVSMSRHDTAWTAVVRIPFGTLGDAPKRTGKWQVDFVRNRCNVQRERSAWHWKRAEQTEADWGSLVFK